MAKDGNAGSKGIGDYKMKGRMDSPWFSGNDDSAGRKAMEGAPSVKGMDGCGKGGTRDGTSGANAAGGAGRKL
jgi:hypothetical protein